MFNEYAKIKANIHREIPVVDAAVVRRADHEQPIRCMRFGLGPAIHVMDVQPQSIGTTWYFAVVARPVE